ncbi:MAG TPA: DUF488 family protein [Nitrosopumilaceae archaeon]|nr:DUF488 family protein [Nitrosopumilaceae archaeon]
MIKIKRIYEEFSKNDGYRILVDRLWPRGISKERAKIDSWLIEVTPSNYLRKWYSHDPKKWKEFQIKYKKELKDKSDTLDDIKHIEKEKKIVTLLYAAKDKQHTHAIVLLKILEKMSITLK